MKLKLMKMAAEAIQVSEQMLGRPKSEIDIQNLDTHFDARASLDKANRVAWDGRNAENFSVFEKKVSPQK